MFDIDRLIVTFDNGLRTLFGPAVTSRPVPGAELPDSEMAEAQRQHAAALMRVNHTGEVCAQALYQGQALTARSSRAQAALDRAAQEETEHLAWTERRIEDLGGVFRDRRRGRTARRSLESRLSGRNRAAGR